MSQATVEKIVGRLVLDADFRQQMAKDRTKALAGYELTDEERAGLANLDLAEIEGAASALDERVSKGLLGN